jgi:hypothetical protein
LSTQRPVGFGFSPSEARSSEGAAELYSMQTSALSSSVITMCSMPAGISSVSGRSARSSTK